jgi:D-glycero-alpha-D-manno-heptose-7-phosphate kinase
MIICRSPLRITLGGGGTDLPSYYLKQGGFLISAAINKYVYVSISRPFHKGIFLKYSKHEHVREINKIKHPIIREVLKLMKIKNPQIEIASFSDIPAGTGLGSSGSFTTALIKGLYHFYGKKISKKKLAELACHVELKKLKEPIGKQDQLISSYGGIKCILFSKQNKININDLKISSKTEIDLKRKLVLFFTGASRKASKILKDQNTKSNQNNKKMIDNLNFIKGIGYKSKKALELGDTLKFASLMHEHWNFKKLRSKNISTKKINNYYNLAYKNGSAGGKLVGAGGGGFLMVYATNKKKLKKKMLKSGLSEVEFDFDYEGSKIIS